MLGPAFTAVSLLPGTYHSRSIRKLPNVACNKEARLGPNIESWILLALEHLWERRLSLAHYPYAGRWSSLGLALSLASPGHSRTRGQRVPRWKAWSAYPR